MSQYFPSSSPQILGRHYGLTTGDDYQQGPLQGFFEMPLRSFGSLGFISFNWNHTKHNGKYTFGFTFLSAKLVTTYRPSESFTNRSTIGVRQTTYIGSKVAEAPILPFQWSNRLQDGRFYWDSESRLTDLSGLGATAWNRLRPDKPDFSFAQELMELKDLPGMLKGETRRIIQQMATATGAAVSQAREDAKRELARERKGGK